MKGVQMQNDKPRISVLSKSLSLLVMLLALLAGISLSSQAAEFVTVSIANAITYDAPSAQAKPVYQYTQGSPLEVYLKVEGWIKVRDQFDVLQWIPQEHVASKRMVMVKANQTKLFKTAQAQSNLLAVFNRDVLLELISTSAQNGWVKVKHQDGLQGYVSVSEVWGI
jgi:SH3-like domain-containing protein